MEVPWSEGSVPLGEVQSRVSAVLVYLECPGKSTGVVLSEELWAAC